jgi:hypothetical protein
MAQPICAMYTTVNFFLCEMKVRGVSPPTAPPIVGFKKHIYYENFKDF